MEIYRRHYFRSGPHISVNKGFWESSIITLFQIFARGYKVAKLMTTYKIIYYCNFAKHNFCSGNWSKFFTLADLHKLGRELCGWHACHVPCVAYDVCVKVKYRANKGKSFANVRYFRLVALFLLPYSLNHLFLYLELWRSWHCGLTNYERSKSARFFSQLFFI